MNLRMSPIPLILWLCLQVVHMESWKEDYNDNRHHQKRSPLDIGGRSRGDKWSSSPSEHTRDTGYLYSSDASGANFNKNNASQKVTFKGNPNEYTIGGVLSGTKDVEHYFTQVLSVSFSLDENP